MRVAVCYKWVVDEADLSVQESDRSLKFDKVKYKISEYDRNALELGAMLQENLGWELYAISIGPDVEPSIKDALSRGPEKAYYINSPVLENSDSSVSAKVLAGIIKKIGSVDLVICGEGSSDSYSQQVGPRMAALLGYHALTYVSDLKVSESRLTAERKLDDDIEVVKVSGPTVLTVLPDINKPRIPSLKQILAAKKKPVEKFSLEELGYKDTDLQSTLEVKRVFAPIMERKQIKLNEDGLSISEAAGKLIKELKADKVI